jgi:PucR-like helix-turn-helix protein/diguanylate cyclase with GGDEF domain
MDLADRLRERSDEIEQATLARVHAVSDPAEVDDPEYTLGLREAVGAAIEYTIAAVEAVGRELAPVPGPLLAQARAAARNGVPLDTVLRRYSAGYTLLGDFIIGEAEAGSLMAGAKLQDVLRIVAAIFDRLVAAVSDEYTREANRHPATPTERRDERVRKLLAGEPIDTTELGYEFDAHHVGVIAVGQGARGAIQDLAATLDRRLLSIHPDEITVWAWFGCRYRFDPTELERPVSESLPSQVSLAIGEPGHGLAGWRLTHQQARAALPIALRRSRALVHYADVALLASILQDDLLATSLRQLYLLPLERERDGGGIARKTLRAYFAAERNASSAAAALGVNRNTVASRLRAIEMLVDRPLVSCASELEAALWLDELDEPRLSLAGR